ncbi:hypothetical protein BKA63DRAFT_317848 [Paraphoma chrysanthemicola]|nr:hypothetical protein BKA63DRAFT_317848 [Paraphoma chrysanthemicola]
MPTITAAALMIATPNEKAMLHDIYALLDKLFIRNKNQHRRSHWWKSLAAFRKQLGLLLSELELSSAKEKEDKLQARLRYWDQGDIHQWYCQFSQLVAVGPFAVLGLVMMASVARVCRVCGITAVYEEIGSAEMKGVLSAVDELALADEFGGVLDEGEGWDEGVVVEREE